MTSSSLVVITVANSKSRHASLTLIQRLFSNKPIGRDANYHSSSLAKQSCCSVGVLHMTQSNISYQYGGRGSCSKVL